MMVLQNLSLAGSLCLVALGLFANAGVDWASAAQKTARADAFAEGGHRSMPESGVHRMSDKSSATSPLRGGEGCVRGETLGWFGTMRALPQCVGNTSYIGFWNIGINQGMTRIDVNGDGQLESVTTGRLNTDPDSPCLVRRDELEATDEGIIVRRDCVLDVERLNALLVSAGYPQIPPDADTMSISGWRDIDRDGDLDLFAYVLGVPFCFVNTGFEATQPLTGDLDGDGAVGASDLTILLGGWTGQ